MLQGGEGPAQQQQSSAPHQQASSVAANGGGGSSLAMESPTEPVAFPFDDPLASPFEPSDGTSTPSDGTSTPNISLSQSALLPKYQHGRPEIPNLNLGAVIAEQQQQQMQGGGSCPSHGSGGEKSSAGCLTRDLACLRGGLSSTYF